MTRARPTISAGVAIGLAALVAGCVRPSEKYGLAPVDPNLRYPSLAGPPERSRPALTPEEQAGRGAGPAEASGTRPRGGATP